MKTSLPAIHFWNTRSHSLERFSPIAKPQKGKKTPVGLYSCGPTVYQRAHIGNMRAYVFADTLSRLLRSEGFDVRHVINITDVGHLTDDADVGEDKLEREAKRVGNKAQDIARRFTRLFLSDLKLLHVTTRGVLFPRASAHIKEQIALVRALEKKGLTYRTRDGVYFDTSKYKAYGALEPNRARGQKSGARVAMGEKKSPTDFALWKFSPSGGEKRQQEWKSPWGVGFPGWHLECSAMSMKYLGKSFDIHTGGIDHVPVHHTNEIAQSEAVTGRPLANYWMHNAFMTVGAATRMGKSEGNALTLDELESLGCEPLDLRYLFLQTHYRKTMQFSKEALFAARSARLALSERAMQPDKGINYDVVPRMLAVLGDDLNTAKALAILWNASRQASLTKNVIKAANELLGLNLGKIQAIPKEVQDIFEKRRKARAMKDWKTSDVLRETLLARGYRVDDGSAESTIHRL